MEVWESNMMVILRDDPPLPGNSLGRDGVVPIDHDNFDPGPPTLGYSIRHRIPVAALAVFPS